MKFTLDWPVYGVEDGVAHFHPYVPKMFAGSLVAINLSPPPRMANLPNSPTECDAAPTRGSPQKVVTASQES